MPFAHKKLFGSMLSFLKWLSGSDKRVLLVLVVLTFLTRSPLIFSPESTIADEFFYSDLTMLVESGTPLFHVHPPLPLLLFSFALTPFSFTQGPFPVDIGVPFGDFPFMALRFVVLGFGVLLPLLLFLIGRISGLSTRYAALPALFVVFDNALTLYGATIHPDMMLLFFNMAALGAGLVVHQTKNKNIAWGFTLFSGIFFGLALSVKWTALGMLVPLSLLFLWKKPFMLRQFFALCFTALIIYIAIFAYFFTLFIPRDSVPETVVPYYAIPQVTDLRYPDPKNNMAILRFLPFMHHAIMAIQTDQGVIASWQKVPSPRSWPLAQSTLLYWWDKDTADGKPFILLIGNPFLWVSVFILFIFALYRYGRGVIKNGFSSLAERKIPVILMAGYLANYLPFFLIHRPTYLYHYFTSLLFLFLLIPHLIPEIRAAISKWKYGQGFAPVLFAFFAILGIAGYIVLLPVTYGW